MTLKEGSSFGGSQSESHLAGFSSKEGVIPRVIDLTFEGVVEAYRLRAIQRGDIARWERASAETQVAAEAARLRNNPNLK